MKLRNKKTGEAIETCKIIQNAFGGIIMLTLNLVNGVDGWNEPFYH